MKLAKRARPQRLQFLAQMLLVFAITALTPVAASDNQTNLRANEARIVARIEALSAFGRNPEGGVSRVAYSEADIAGRAYIVSLMREIGLAVRVDVSGNIIGRRVGRDEGLPPIMIGSHIDSVPNGGNYDGDVGVIGALEVVQILAESGTETQHPVEVIVFSNEEGGLVGSRAMTSGLDDKALSTVSHSGFTIAEGTVRIGGDPKCARWSTLGPGDLAAYLELHIEQGAVLDKEDIDIGVVEGIVGVRWWDVTVEGVANHAGTTPMKLRRDPLVAAAQLILAVDETARSFNGDQVATVGRIQAYPGAPNVIPGKVGISIEVRDLSQARMAEVFAAVETRARAIEKASQTRVSFTEVTLNATPAPTDPGIRDVIEQVATKLGLSAKRMPSGAGHDAQEMARITPVGMIFVPSIGGISHAPAEFTTPADMANGTTVLLHALLALDRQGS